MIKDKVAEQHILGIYSNCNSFGVTMDLLNSHNFKVAILFKHIYLQLDNNRKSTIISSPFAE